jgi:predicted phage terminase large subunit-like protein
LVVDIKMITDKTTLQKVQDVNPTEDDLRLLETVYLNPWISSIKLPNDDWLDPYGKQARFLRCSTRECLFGGAAGPGKSWSLMMAALQYVTEPQYNALILRRTYKDLALPGALMDVSHQWLDGISVNGETAHWDAVEKQWTFPSGATITFGYLATQKDLDQYQGAQWQFVGFDELTQFIEPHYLYLFSRNRTTKDDPIPLRIWSTSNPGGRGHNWVKQRFLVEGETKGRTVIRAWARDNPYLDSVEYEKSLQNLDPVTRAQLLDGNWDQVATGGFFLRQWFETLPTIPAGSTRVRFWDIAATPKSASGRDPDWTAGALVAIKDGVYYLVNIVKTQSTAHDVESLIRRTADADGPGTAIVMEQEPGASGIQVLDYYRRNVLQDRNLKAYRPTGPKQSRIAIVSSHAEAGNLKLISGAWISDFLDEAELYPDGAHDDQLDAVAGAIGMLQAARGRTRIKWFGGIRK